jgi:LmeA-like phospholipid-binding
MSRYEYDSPGRRHHPLRIVIIVVIVLAALLVGADFAARAFAENKAASEIKQQGFPKKPSVDIEGFPFLTQVAAHEFHDIQISSSNVTEGPLDIESINASLKDVHINGAFSGGTIDSLDGTAAVTFTALSNAMTSEAGPLGQLASAGLTLSAHGSDEVKATLNAVVFSGTAVWRVTSTYSNDINDINVDLVSTGGLPKSLLQPVSDLTLRLPPLPLHLRIQSISVTPSGLVGTLTGQNVSFGS